MPTVNALTKPLKLTAIVHVTESSGRPVERTLTRAVAPGGVQIGIRPLFEGAAEEGGNGAVAMIEDGVLEDPAVDAAFGLHLWNHLDVGKVAIVDGAFFDGRIQMNRK